MRLFWFGTSVSTRANDVVFDTNDLVVAASREMSYMGYGQQGLRPTGATPQGLLAHRGYWPTAHRDYGPQGIRPTGNTAQRGYGPQGYATAHREYGPGGYGPQGLRPTGATAHRGYGPQGLRATEASAHKGYGPQGLLWYGPQGLLAYGPLGIPQGLRPIGVTAHRRAKVQRPRRPVSSSSPTTSSSRPTT